MMALSTHHVRPRFMLRSLAPLQDAVDRFFPLLAVNGVYTFSGGKVKLADKRFTSVKHEYELQFDDKATIMPTDDDRRIATNVYSFVPIAGIAGVEPNKNIDVLAIVVNPGSAAVIKVRQRAREPVERACPGGTEHDYLIRRQWRW